MAEAFLGHLPFALDMARFPEAERRLLHKMICMQFAPYVARTNLAGGSRVSISSPALR